MTNPKPLAAPPAACMQETVADNGRLQVCARTKGHKDSHWSRAGWLWTEKTPAEVAAPLPEPQYEVDWEDRSSIYNSIKAEKAARKSPYANGVCPGCNTKIDDDLECKCTRQSVSPLPEIADPDDRQNLAHHVYLHDLTYPGCNFSYRGHRCNQTINAECHQRVAAPVPLGEPAIDERAMELTRIAVFSHGGLAWPNILCLREVYRQLDAALATKAVPIGEGELEHTDGWLMKHPRPSPWHTDEAGKSYVYALEDRIRWLNVGIDCSRVDRAGFKKRAELAESELSRLKSQEGSN